MIYKLKILRMKTKYLLTGLVLPALFAACTAEDVVAPQQSDINVNDLTSRPVVGEIELGIGADAQTRATLADDGWSDILFSAEDGDAIGARIIDTYTPGAEVKDYQGKRIAWPAYTVQNDYASSNYQFNYADGKWKTEALMVEGNYMFYFPYNAKNVSRKPVDFVLPEVQTVKPNETDGARNAIADLYAGDEPAFVGYKFISAESGLEQQIQMHPVFAYPLFTVINDYVAKTVDGVDYYEDVTIDSVVFVSNNFTVKSQARHSNIATNLTEAMEYLVYKNTSKPAEGTKKGDKSISAGVWSSNLTFLDATYSHIADVKTTSDAKVTVVFEGGKKLAANGGTWSFYTVLPAVKYTDLTAQVYVNGGDMFETPIKIANDVDKKVLTFAPGKRYPREEYNIKEGVKPTIKEDYAGDLATFRLSKGGKIKPAEVVYLDKPIVDLEDFEELLESVDHRDRPLVEVSTLADIKNVDTGGNKVRHFVLAKATDKNGNALDYANLQINADFYKTLAVYSDANVSFCSKMQVVGAAKAADRLDVSGETFKGGVVVADGFVGLGDAVKAGLTVSKGDVTAGTVTGALTVSGGVANVTKAGEVTVNGGSATVSTATRLTVNGGALTVNGMNTCGATVNGGTLNANAKLGGITAKGGTANIGVAYLTAADNNVNTINVQGGKVVFDGDKTDAAGNVVVASNDGKANRLNIVNGTVEVAANNELYLGSSNTIEIPAKKSVAINNYGKLSTDNLDIQAAMTLKNYGEWKYGTAKNEGIIYNGTSEAMAVVSGTSLTNDSVIYNYSDRVVLAANNGTVYMKDHAAELTVNGGTGTIDNQEKAHLVIASTAQQTVVYTMSGNVTNATLEGLDTKKYLINKVVFNGAKVVLDEAFDVTAAGLSDVLYGVTTLDFIGGTLLIEDNITVNIQTVNISGIVEFKGWGDGIYTLEDAVIGTINLAANSELTINDMTLKNVQFVATPLTADEFEAGAELGTWTTVGEGKALEASNTEIEAGTVTTPAN